MNEHRGELGTRNRTVWFKLVFASPLNIQLRRQFLDCRTSPVISWHIDKGPFELQHSIFTEVVNLCCQYTISIIRRDIFQLTVIRNIVNASTLGIKTFSYCQA
ncbi:hypothetical protein D3C78_1133840 [compost metagenome]